MTESGTLVVSKFFMTQYVVGVFGGIEDSMPYGYPTPECRKKDVYSNPIVLTSQGATYT
jgi:hypothetical protein